MQDVRGQDVAPLAPPPRATSRASSYHTVLDHFIHASTTGSAESLSSTVRALSHSPNNTSSPPTSPEPEYEIIKRERHAKALVIEHPTLVNFVPTSEIQTAVSQTADRIIIDTILPPTAALRASDRVNRAYAYQPQHDQDSRTGFDTREILNRHEQQLKQSLDAHLSSNYDPTGTIKVDIFKTLSELTRFPDPVGIKGCEYSKDQCPCICCELGCENRVQPYREMQNAVSFPSSLASPPQLVSAQLAASNSPALQLSTAPNTSTLACQQKPTSTCTSQGESTSAQQMHSFLEMTDASVRRTRHQRCDCSRASNEVGQRSSRAKQVFGLLSFGRHSRSRSQLDTCRDAACQHDGSSRDAGAPGMPTAAPALPAELTEPVLARPAKPGRSRSFSSLVKRRRGKHALASQAEPCAVPVPATTPVLGASLSVNGTLFDIDPASSPRRSSSQLGRTRDQQVLEHVASNALDSAHSASLVTPATPPRRSSKTYALVHHAKPRAPHTGACAHTGSARHSIDSVPATAFGTYVIDEIVQQDGLATNRHTSHSAHVSRRQSALMSSYPPPYEHTQSHQTTRPAQPAAIDQAHSQIGVAL